MKLSDADIRILGLLQRDASLSLAALSERLGIAQSTIWRRVNEMEQAGVIRRRVAVLDPRKVGAGLCILAHVTLEDHSENAVEAFAKLVEAHKEIQECHKISGVADYLLKVRAASVDAYETFQTRHLLRNAYVRSVQSSFVLKEVKSTTELPL